MSFKIPKEYISKFETLSKISIENVELLGEFITTIPSGTGPSGFKELLKERFADDKDIQEISSIVYSFGSLLLQNETSLDQLAEEIFDSVIINFNSKSSELTEKDSFQYKILLLLKGCNNLKFTFKALELLSENERIYRDSRIITDLRLIFNDDLAQSKRNAVIIHRFKIESRYDNEYENTFFSLDTSDLIKIKTLIERALEKEKVMKENYSDITFIDISE